MVFGVTLGRRKQPHLFQSVIDSFAPPVLVVMDESEKSHLEHASFAPTEFLRNLKRFFFAGSYHRILLPAVSVNLP